MWKNFENMLILDEVIITTFRAYFLFGHSADHVQT